MEWQKHTDIDNRGQPTTADTNIHTHTADGAAETHRYREQGTFDDRGQKHTHTADGAADSRDARSLDCSKHTDIDDRGQPTTGDTNIHTHTQQMEWQKHTDRQQGTADDGGHKHTHSQQMERQKVEMLEVLTAVNTQT